MATGKKTGGRRKGTPNRATSERQAAVAASGITPLAIMMESARWAHAQATQLTEELAEAEPSLETEELFTRMMRLRHAAVAWAHCAAPYVHPRLAAIAHKLANSDGSPVRPTVNVYIDGEPLRDNEPERLALAETGPSSSDKRH
jgi:hypothetical protein